MEFAEDDTEEERRLKFRVLEYYNARIDERIRRKKFIIERGLLDIKKQQKLEKKRTKEEREIINSMKPFARFSTKEEHENLVNHMLKEYHLRVLIAQFKYFKGQGCTNLDDIESYIEKKKPDGKMSMSETSNFLSR